MLKENYQNEIDEILSRYPVKRSALLPLLYLAQREEDRTNQELRSALGGALRAFIGTRMRSEPGRITLSARLKCRAKIPGTRSGQTFPFRIKTDPWAELSAQAAAIRSDRPRRGSVGWGGEPKKVDAAARAARSASTEGDER